MTNREQFNQMLNSRKDPQQAVAILTSLSAGTQMTNNEKFCAFVNSCEDPHRVLNALRALAPITRAAKAVEKGGTSA